MSFSDYSRKHKPVTSAEATLIRQRAIARGEDYKISLVDPELDEVWARGVKDNRNAVDSYYDYYFSGQDIQVRVAGIPETDSRFGTLPIIQLAYKVEQQKVPVHGFWSYCVDDETEALTKRGWVCGEDLREDDIILSMDPKSGALKWSAVLDIFREYQTNRPMHRLSGSGIDALVTPGHRFATIDGELKPVEGLRRRDSIRIMGTAIDEASDIYSDAFVELVGWYVTEGHDRKDCNSIEIAQSLKVNPDKVDRIELCLKRLGVNYGKYPPKKDSGVIKFYIGTKETIVGALKEVAPSKILSYDFITRLSTNQRNLLINTMLDGDGSRPGKNGRQYGQGRHTVDQLDPFMALCAMAGIATYKSTKQLNGQTTVTLKVRSVASVYSINFHGGWRDGRSNEPHSPTETYTGLVWCPKTEYGTFVCRRGNRVYVTGNTYDAVMRGNRIVNGTMTLATRYPNYMRDLLAEAARKRSSLSQSDDVFVRHITDDDRKIQQYWHKTLDPAYLQASSSLVFSSHPPFNLVVVYGIQNISVPYNTVSDSYQSYYQNHYSEKDNTIMSDTNHRLVESDPQFANRIVIEAIELTGLTREYTPDGSVCMETYDFFARDTYTPPTASNNIPRNT